MAEKMTERDQFYYDKGYNKAIEEAADLARKPNKMQIVAAQFGKKLGEEFIVKGRYGDKIHCMFWEDGLKYHDGLFVSWGKADDSRLADLLTGKAVIVDD